MSRQVSLIELQVSSKKLMKLSRTSKTLKSKRAKYFPNCRSSKYCRKFLILIYLSITAITLWRSKNTNLLLVTFTMFSKSLHFDFALSNKLQAKMKSKLNLLRNLIVSAAMPMLGAILQSYFC